MAAIQSPDPEPGSSEINSNTGCQQDKTIIRLDNSSTEIINTDIVKQAAADFWEHGEWIKEQFCKQHQRNKFLACSPSSFWVFPSQFDADDAEYFLAFSFGTRRKCLRQVDCQVEDLLEHIECVEKRGYHDELGVCTPV
ncbi:uncharacterized protein CIMG_08408 [Coccidioides immitis RS]|uniref:Uncharacterized protein n=1 Tax=Coccidioides immitis (strain RS) TaxID=246410 RepID=J3K5G0_COCIM|nr:uncharacterized protein CIMG_08408 [Coccidioides immitis RS]EAS29662.3 hypothetical protein CIMG_08408 [Coccidioides immitis RS]